MASTFFACAGSARELVATCLASGRREEACTLCRMHYCAQSRGYIGHGATAAATGVSRGTGTREGATVNSAFSTSSGSTSEAVLKRFVEEFGLELPPAEAH